ncbi:MAG: DUF4070 domain-containing protein, partial [Cyanobacteria bacterium P01_A01_bin.84]
ASVDLAEDAELLELMAQAGFYGVFLGIETPDTDSLEVTRKFQNIRKPLVEACNTINQAGLLVYAGFIIGFDAERSGAGERIQAFIEETTIPQPMLGILQAIPNTNLWHRLEQEQRLLAGTDGKEVKDQNSLMNFVPTRPTTEIAQEYVEAIWKMYEPQKYLRRCFEQCLRINPNPNLQQNMYFPPGKGIKLIAQVILRQGLQRKEIRAQFWKQLWAIIQKKPQFLNMYLGLCAAGEHFWEYRLLTRERITQQLGFDPLNKSKIMEKELIAV